jgi:hypothetical protein
MPASGKNAARVRDPKEAEKDLLVLQEIMEQVETCEYGLWTLNEHSPTSRIAFHKADKETGCRGESDVYSANHLTL